MPPLYPIKPGDPLPTDPNFWESVQRAALRAQLGQPGRSGGELPPTTHVPQVTIFVRNDTADPLDAFAVVKLGDPLIDPTDDPHAARLTPAFKGTAPSSYQDPFAVLVVPLAAGEIGRAVVLGVVPVKVAINNAGDTWAGPAAALAVGMGEPPGAGVASLLSRTDDGPAKIIWADAPDPMHAARPVWALVLLQGTAGGSGGAAAESLWKTPGARARTTTGLPANTYSNGTSGVGATLTGTSNGALSAQDGVTLSVNQDLLVANESTQSHNGLYTLTQVGDSTHPYILTRRTDADSAAGLLDAIVPVSEGTTNKDTVWKCTADATITVGTTALPWVQIGGGSGSITVEEVDGSPSGAVSKIQFDQADGFTVTIGSAARIDLVPATATQNGGMTTAAQVFAGAKTFNDGIVVLDAGVTFIDANAVATQISVAVKESGESVGSRILFGTNGAGNNSTPSVGFGMTFRAAQTSASPGYLRLATYCRLQVFDSSGSTTLRTSVDGNVGLGARVSNGVMVRRAVDPVVVSAGTAITADTPCVLVDTSAGSVTVDLPPIGSTPNGLIVYVKKIHASNTLTVRVDFGSGNTIYSLASGNTSVSMTGDGEAYTFLMDQPNSRWVVVGYYH